jgi:transcriptional regulator with XRE-family HTH domain
MEIRTDDLPVPVQMKIFRMLAGISAREMARRWGRSQAYVYRVERGDTAPMPLEYLDAQVLGAEAYMTAARPAVISRGAGAAVREAEEAAREAEALTGDAPDEGDPPRDEDEPQPGRFG